MKQVASLSVLWQAEAKMKKVKPLTFHHVVREGKMGSLHEIIKVRESVSENTKASAELCLQYKDSVCP